MHEPSAIWPITLRNQNELLALFKPRACSVLFKRARRDYLSSVAMKMASRSRIGALDSARLFQPRYHANLLAFEVISY
ncbi:hypothetical protein VNO77_41824 [Canavalia gladiata]|uniref:Uncharacterized protein n=1 Tax=Canavalia gladiata TaxID=3824 RepID=A0AAN9PSB3_CANGL